MQYKTYKVTYKGHQIAEVEYPSDESNCWFFGVRVWSKEKGWARNIQHLDAKGELFELVAE